MSDLFMCVWCGGPTDKDGRRMSAEEAVLADGDCSAVTLTNGDCCPGGNDRELARQEREAMELAAYHDEMMEDTYGSLRGY